jgi:ABC-type antimicrobial peptide transport system permease subunit
MRILLLNHIENARESLRSNRMRTRLTILGITLGVACMTTIMALSFGAIKLIDEQVNALGGNLLLVRPGVEQAPKTLRDIATPSSEAFSVSTLTEQDFSAIEKLEGVEQAAPLMSVSASISSHEETVRDGTIVATTPALETVSDLKVRDGQFIDSVTNKNTAVVGRQLSVDLFGTDQSIGQTFKIRGQQFTVIGILRSVDEAVNYNNFNMNKTAIINLESGKQLNQGLAQIRQINVKAKNASKVDALKSDIVAALKQKHDNQQDFRVLTGSEISRPTSQLFSAVSVTAGIVATISLIIGGIGIMNIMLVSVAERTREIGIRKAVGASNYHIHMQFMIESLAMSLSGGVTGLLLGYAAAFGASFFLPFTPGFAWFIPAIALGVAALVGTLFGLYPAIRAARKNPIEALRQYH